MDAACRFAQNIVRTRFADIPAAAVEATRKQVLDALGVALAGCSAAGVEQLVELNRSWGGAEQSSVILRGIRLPAPNAAQINASMIHALDFDDTHESAVMHPGAVAVAVSLAAAECRGGVSGEELLTAVALGTDLMCRAGLAITPGPGGSRLRTGWHLTSVFGYLGAAASAGRILGLGEEQMLHALGIAYHQAAGNGQCVVDGALTKRLGPGFAARGGMTAALMAQRGITGARNSLEGDFGMYPLYYRGGYDPAVLRDELGRRFEGVNVSFKPYPSCRATHPYIDAALDLSSRYRIRTDELDKVVAYHGEGARIVFEPLAQKLVPRNTVDSQFSAPWTIAVALARGRVCIDDFTEKAIQDEAILKVSRRIETQFDGRLKGEALQPGRLEVTMHGGQVYTTQVDDPLGSPRNPMSVEDCVEKFMDCAAHGDRTLPAADLDRIVEAVCGLEKLGDATEIIRMVAGP